MRPQYAMDHQIAGLASRQHGIVTRPQLRTLGLSDRGISRRLASGRLFAVHPAVYAVGHRVVGQRGRWLAAVWACGPTAVLSHGSAAALWDLTATQPRDIHVTLPSSTHRTGPAGVALHRSPSLAAIDMTVRDGVPVTGVARTLLDVAPGFPLRKLRRAFGQADALRILDFADLDRLLTAHPRRAGTPKLREVAAEHRAEEPLSRSDFEDRLVELCVLAGLPMPRVNAHVAGLEVDVSWPEALVVAEADSYAYHGTWAAMQRDRRRDAKLHAAGCLVHRFTDGQLRDEPEEVIAAVRRSLADRGRIAS